MRKKEKQNNNIFLEDLLQFVDAKNKNATSLKRKTEGLAPR